MSGSQTNKRVSTVSSPLDLIKSGYTPTRFLPKPGEFVQPIDFLERPIPASPVPAKVPVRPPRGMADSPYINTQTPVRHEETQRQARSKTIERNPRVPLVQLVVDGEPIDSAKLSLDMSLSELRLQIVKRNPNIGAFVHPKTQQPISEHKEKDFTLTNVMVKNGNINQLHMKKNEIGSLRQGNVRKTEGSPIRAPVSPKQYLILPANTLRFMLVTPQTQTSAPSDDEYLQRLENFDLDIYRVPHQEPVKSVIGSNFAKTFSKCAPRKLVLIGAQGAGKTKFLNALLNNLKHVTPQQKYRYYVTNEALDQDGHPEPTNTITEYCFPQGVLNQGIQIVDTPGFSENPFKREKQEQELQNFLEDKMASANFVCFVINSHVTRMTPAEASVYGAIVRFLNRFPSCRVVFVLTHCDLETSSIERQIRNRTSLFAALTGSQATDPIFKFNFSSLYQKFDSRQHSQDFWQLSAQGFEQFKDLLQYQPASNFKTLSNPISSQNLSAKTSTREPAFDVEKFISDAKSSLKGLLVDQIRFCWELEPQPIAIRHPQLSSNKSPVSFGVKHESKLNQNSIKSPFVVSGRTWTFQTAGHLEKSPTRQLNLQRRQEGDPARLEVQKGHLHHLLKGYCALVRLCPDRREEIEHCIIKECKQEFTQNSVDCLPTVFDHVSLRFWDEINIKWRHCKFLMEQNKSTDLEEYWNAIVFGQHKIKGFCPNTLTI